jgi:ATP/maltotriose-dependent transcriptional regulator MalT
VRADGSILEAMTDVSDDLAAARAAFERHEWGVARAGFLAARSQGPLGAADMAALADAAWWQGAVDESTSAMEEAYRLHLHGDDPAPRAAAMLAMDMGFLWFLRGEDAMGSGWLSRAQRLLQDEPPSVEHAYLETMAIEGATGAGDFTTAREMARSIAATARSYGDETLEALALVGDGIATIKQGQVTEGLAVLDEAMLPVVAGRVRPAFAGSIYCQLMSICHELTDLRRAEQWTEATSRWCEGFDSAVMFIGVCRMHRAQLLQVRGAWAEAEAEIARVCDELARMNVVAVGMAYYELAEVRRCRGDLAGAEVAYAEGHRLGRDPHPGLALVWLAQGRHGAAFDALASTVGSTVDPLARTRLLGPLVEAAVAVGDLDAARRAADHLDDAARTYASSGLVAAAALARGRVRLASGDVDGAIASLSSARRGWQDLGARYQVTQVRRLLADALSRRGDEAAAALERSAVEAELRALGVRDDPGRTRPQGFGPGRLTAREVEVLSLVAQGLSNRDVAAALVLSEKTVARHLANIFSKLGVTSRTAAAAFAFEHGLVASAMSPPA